MSLLKDLKHANIVTLHDIVHTPKSLTLVFEYLVSSAILSSACKTGVTFFALVYACLLGDPTQTSQLFSLLAPRFINVTPGAYKYSVAFYWVVLLPYGNCCFVVRLGKRSEAIHGWLWRNNEYEQRQSKWKGFISFFSDVCKVCCTKTVLSYLSRFTVNDESFSPLYQFLNFLDNFYLSPSSPPLSGRMVSVNFLFLTFRYSCISY